MEIVGAAFILAVVVTLLFFFLKEDYLDAGQDLRSLFEEQEKADREFEIKAAARRAEDAEEAYYGDQDA